MPGAAVNRQELEYLAKNFDKRVEVCGGRVIFDSENGAGSTGNNANVRYMGGAVLMLPRAFLALVAPLDDHRDRTSAYLPTVAATKGWGPPMLYLDLDDQGLGHVTGHEGRHRAIAFEHGCPGTPLLVHLLPRGEAFRARDLKLPQLNKLRSGLFRELWHTRTSGTMTSARGASGGEWVAGPLFETAFVLDKAITWP